MGVAAALRFSTWSKQAGLMWTVSLLGVKVRELMGIGRAVVKGSETTLCATTGF